MPQNLSFLQSAGGLITITFTAIIGFFTAVLGYHTKNNYVKKEDFKEYCKEMRTSCNEQVCKKIDDIKLENGIMFRKLDLIIKNQSDSNSELAALKSSFNQYKEDMRNGKRWQQNISK